MPVQLWSLLTIALCLTNFSVSKIFSDENEELRKCGHTTKGEQKIQNRNVHHAEQSCRDTANRWVKPRGRNERE
jgi:hypothetical protein